VSSGGAQPDLRPARCTPNRQPGPLHMSFVPAPPPPRGRSHRPSPSAQPPQTLMRGKIWFVGSALPQKHWFLKNFYADLELPPNTRIWRERGRELLIRREGGTREVCPITHVMLAVRRPARLRTGASCLFSSHPRLRACVHARKRVCAHVCVRCWLSLRSRKISRASAPTYPPVFLLAVLCPCVPLDFLPESVSSLRRWGSRSIGTSCSK